MGWVSKLSSEFEMEVLFCCSLLTASYVVDTPSFLQRSMQGPDMPFADLLDEILSGR